MHATFGHIVLRNRTVHKQLYVTSDACMQADEALTEVKAAAKAERDDLQAQLHAVQAESNAAHINNPTTTEVPDCPAEGYLQVILVKCFPSWHQSQSLPCTHARYPWWRPDCDMRGRVLE